MKYSITISPILMLLILDSCTLSGSRTNLTDRNVEDSTKATWHWADSLDALVAAGNNHKLIFENEEYRVLHVTIIPGIIDPIHTHKWKSLIWITSPSIIVYKTYDIGPNRALTLVKEDTSEVKTENLKKGFWENPEPPHSVENIGKDTFELYRIEYKSELQMR